jgi:CTP:phosphocholine cytidylyltransferase-like protein
MFEGAVYGYYLASLDLADDCIEYRYLTDSDTQLHQNIQANDLDGQKDEYLTEAGLMFANEKRHALGTDIKS